MSILCSMVGATFGVAAVAEILRSKKGIAAVGNAQIDTAQSKFGGASLLGDGTGDYLQLPTDSSLELTGDFTVEMWYRIPGSVPAILPFYNSDHLFYLTNDGGTAKYALFQGGSNRLLSSGITVSANTWYHFAMVRSGTTVTAYHNGTSAGSAQWAGTISGTTPTIGSYSSYFINGHYDEIRISNIARYTTGFTAPTEAFVNDANTLLLIHANGTDATTFFEDDNGVRSQRGITAIGNAQIDTAQSKFGGTAALFDGTGDYLLSSAGAQWNFGSSSFTIEYFIRFNVAPTLYVPIALRPGVSINNGEWWCEITNAEKKMYWGFKNSAGTQYYVNLALAGTAFTTGVWYHIALVNNAGTAQLYIDGVATGTTTALAGTFGNLTSDLWVGAGAGAYSVNGWMDEIRISNTARYKGNFTPPTTAFVNDANTLLLVHADGTDASTVFRDDNGALPATTTGTAVTFDGTGDYYSATGITTSATDSKYLLFVCTFYWAGGNNLQHLADLRLGTGAGDIGFYSWINGGRSQITLVGGGSEYKTMYEDAENSLTSGAWNQIVFYMQTDSTANSRIYINGVSRAFTNSNQNLTTLNWANTATTITIGQKQAAITGTGDDFNGRMAQIYIHNPASFPGVEAFWAGGPRDLGTNGTATGLAQPLLYHYGNNDTFRTNNGTGFASYTLTANGNAGTATANLPTFYSPRTPKGVAAIGNAQVSTAQSYFGGSSLLLDGNGDYLTINNATDLNFVKTDFTIEAWVRFDVLSTSNRHTLISNGVSSFTTGWIKFAAADLGAAYYPQVIAYDYSSGGTPMMTSSTAVSNNTWYHLAWVRSGTNHYLYLDGVQVASATNATAQGINVNMNLNGTQIGRYSFDNGTPPSATYIDGYIDEFRISNTARYTAGFTPSTTPFQNDANTVLLLHMDGTNASTVFFDDNGIAPYTP